MGFILSILLFFTDLSFVKFASNLVLIKFSSTISLASLFLRPTSLTSILLSSLTNPPTSRFLSAGIKTKVSKTFELNFIFWNSSLSLSNAFNAFGSRLSPFKDFKYLLYSRLITLIFCSHSSKDITFASSSSSSDSSRSSS